MKRKKSLKIISLFILTGTVFLQTFNLFSSNEKYFLITHGSADYYWVGIFNGAKEAAKRLNINLQINAPPGAIDIAAQNRMLESAIAAKPAGILTTCSSETVFSSALQKAKKLNIPVIVFDSKPSDKGKNPYDSFIGSDPYLQGKIIADTAISEGKIKNNILIVIPQAGNLTIDKRAEAIKDVMLKANIKADQLLTGSDPSRVQMLVKSYLAKNPDTSAIFSLTSQSLVPIGQIYQSEQFSNKNKPALYSIDNTPETIELIKQGIVNAAVDQQQFLMGYYGINELYLKNTFNYNPVDINTGYKILTKSNI